MVLILWNILKLRAGVDMIQSNRGTLVIEVNSSPGLEGIETTSEIDVASEIIKFMDTIHPRNYSFNPQSLKYVMKNMQLISDSNIKFFDNDEQLQPPYFFLF